RSRASSIRPIGRKAVYYKYLAVDEIESRAQQIGRCSFKVRDHGEIGYDSSLYLLLRSEWTLAASSGVGLFAASEQLCSICRALNIDVITTPSGLLENAKCNKRSATISVALGSYS